MTGLTDALRQDFRVMKVCKVLTVELSYIMMQIHLLDYDSLLKMLRQAFTSVDSNTLYIFLIHFFTHTHAGMLARMHTHTHKINKIKRHITLTCQDCLQYLPLHALSCFLFYLQWEMFSTG